MFARLFLRPEGMRHAKRANTTRWELVMRYPPVATGGGDSEIGPIRTEAGRRLVAGNSDNGGAGYVNDNHPSDANDNRGARLAVVAYFSDLTNPLLSIAASWNRPAILK